MKKYQKIEKKHVQKQRRHAEAHFFACFVIFSDFGSLLGSLLGAFWGHFGEQNSEGFLVCILGSPRREARTPLRLTPRVVRLGKAPVCLARPSPGGGRIVYASRIPPRP